MQEKIQEKFNELSKNITKLQEKAGDVGSDIKDKSNSVKTLVKKENHDDIQKCQIIL